MTMLDDVLGAAVPGAKNRICTLWRRRKAKPGGDPSSTGMFVGKCLIAVLICAASALMMSDAASAKARKGGAKASAPPVLDAQAVDAAQLPAPSGKGSARAPSAAALIKAEIFGTKIMVPNVARKPSEAKVAKVVVNKSHRTVRALDGEGKLVSFYPASVGSQERPAPSGTRPIRFVQENPTYHYAPSLKFKGVKTQKPFDIAPGPKNPVGNTWIDLGDAYGIHGTPEPQRISKTESHGCVRLTNWDARALAKMVQKGTKVEFIN